jgi:hypothetical protein
MTKMTRLWKQLVARKQRRARERYLQERARQEALHARDVQDAEVAATPIRAVG